MSDTARVLLTATVLAASGLGMYGWRLRHLDPNGPERRVGELRLAQVAALMLAASGAVAIGLALANETAPVGPVDVTLGIVFIALAALVQRRDPREGLLVAAGAFVLHALSDIAHRPGLLSPLAPAWYAIGSAIFDVGVAALCYTVRRR